MKVHDLVRLKTSLPYARLYCGQLGVITDVYSEDHFEVKIVDPTGATVFLGHMPNEMVEKVE